MQISEPPTLDELVEGRQKLIEDIEKAEKLFGPEAVEIRTVRSGLKLIDEKIAELRARNGNR